MKDFKFIKNISDSGEGTIELFGQIGDSIDSEGRYVYGISGSGFANELKWLQNNCTSIQVRINSVGGSVIEGYSIVSTILLSKIPVNTIIVGLAASIAGVIAVAGKKCSMMDYGTLMVHNPGGSDDKELLNLVKNTLVTILSGRSGCTPEEMSKMMDKETYLTASDALEKGFVDEVVPSGKKIKRAKKESVENLALVYNKLLNPENTMSKLNAILKLKNDASEESVVSAVEAINTENATLKSENENLKNELEKLKTGKFDKEAAEKEALKNKATELVNKAVTDKKIAESAKQGQIDYASTSEANFETLKNILENTKATTKEAAKVFNVKEVKVANGTEDRSAWTIRDWEKKDEKGLAKMKNESPELYQMLFDAFYKKD